MMNRMLDFTRYVSLLTLFLVAGVFWGVWISLSRSYDAFSANELSRIAQVIVANLATPMRIMSGLCLLLMTTSVVLGWKKSAIQFYLSMAATLLILALLLITVIVEVPINDQVVTWAAGRTPSNWESLRTRWQNFNGIRTVMALISFLLFSYAVVNPFQKKSRQT